MGWDGIGWDRSMSIIMSSSLAHVHAISNLTGDRTNSREGSLKRRGMKLCAPPTLKSATIRGGTLGIKLSTHTFHSLFLSRRQWENMPANSAQGVIVIIQNSLITVFVTNVSVSCQFAAVHVSTHVFIFTFPIALVYRVQPILAQNS